MAFDGSGTFNRPVSDYVFDTVISETDMNTEMDGIATGLSNCMTLDGQSSPSADLPMNSHKFTGLAAGSAAGDSATLGQIQAQAYIWGGTAGGTANAITLTPSPAITAYAAGQAFRFIAASSSTGAVTVAVSGLTTKAIQRDGRALVTADIVSGNLYTIVYDGTQFQLFGTPSYPKFLAYNSASDNNATGAGTTATVDFDTDVFDVGSNFSSDTFTAPIAGRYHFDAQVRLADLASATTVQVDLVTSNRTYRKIIDSPADGDLTVSMSVLADMDVNDTAKVQVIVSGMAGDTVDILGSATVITYFSGHFVE